MVSVRCFLSQDEKEEEIRKTIYRKQSVNLSLVLKLFMSITM